MRKASVLAALVALAIGVSATAATAGNSPFPADNQAGNTNVKRFNAVTADGLMITMIIGQNVSDGASAPFYMRVQRVHGRTDPYLIAGVKFAFDHKRSSCSPNPICWATYTVNLGNVVYGRYKTSTPAAPTTTTTTPTTTAQTSSIGVSKDNPKPKIVEQKTNIEFVDASHGNDSGHHIIRIGQLKNGEWVSFTGNIKVETRADWHADTSLFFRLSVGLNQVNPDDVGYPTPVWSLWASSLYIAH